MNAGSRQVTSHYCKETGHEVDDCQKLATKNAREYAATETIEETRTQMLMARLDNDSFGDQPGGSHDWLFLQQHGINENTNYRNVKSKKSDGGIPTSWILLDNQSTVNVFMNHSLLWNIHTTNMTMKIHCNAEISHMSQVSDLPRYGMVWFHPKGITNILSLSWVKNKYQITFNSADDNTFMVHKPNGTTCRFQESSHGLYYHDMQTSASASLLVTTVDDNKSRYTTQEYSQASLAHKLQCIIGRSSTKDFLKIVNSNLLPNCPISLVDILNVEHIFGPDVGSLKGKTGQKPPNAVHITPLNVPAASMVQCHDVLLAGDIMSVNKIPFLITISHWIKFGTIEVLSDKKLATLLTCCHSLCQLIISGPWYESATFPHRW